MDTTEKPIGTKNKDAKEVFHPEDARDPTHNMPEGRTPAVYNAYPDHYPPDSLSWEAGTLLSLSFVTDIAEPMKTSHLIPLSHWPGDPLNHPASMYDNVYDVVSDVYVIVESPP